MLLAKIKSPQKNPAIWYFFPNSGNSKSSLYKCTIHKSVIKLFVCFYQENESIDDGQLGQLELLMNNTNQEYNEEEEDNEGEEEEGEESEEEEAGSNDSMSLRAEIKKVQNCSSELAHAV